MARKQFWAYGLILALFASACGALTPDNPVATLQAERAGYIAEATSVAQAAQAQGTQVVATAIAAQTYVAQMEGRNRQLIATLQVAFPPTRALVENSGPSTPGQMATPVPAGSVAVATQASAGDTSGGSTIGSARFTQVGTAAAVRDTDDCADSLVYSFPTDVQRIYITTRALNVTAGIQMRAEWYYEGQLTYSEAYSIPRDDDDFCMWLSIAPTEIALSPGNWSVKLFANNQSIDPPSVDFTVGG